MYNLIMILNGETISEKTDDVKSSLLAHKPPVLFTEMYITVTFGKDNIRERRLSLIQGKRLFNNNDVLDAFIVNLFLNHE